MTIEEKYNIHCFLYDITRGHFKSKWLCKHNLHNYMIKYDIKTKKIVEENEAVKITRYKKIFKTYLKCYCCGKEIELKENR